MPQTKNNQQRKSIRIPEGMIKAVDQIVENPNSLYTSRQDFIESAIREKIEKLEKAKSVIDSQYEGAQHP